MNFKCSQLLRLLTTTSENYNTAVIINSYNTAITVIIQLIIINSC